MDIMCPYNAGSGLKSRSQKCVGGDFSLGQLDPGQEISMRCLSINLAIILLWSNPRAVILALYHWATVLQGRHVLIATDKTTVVAYINKQGGTHSHLLLRLVVDLFLWIQTQDITLRARRIPGCLNVIAGRLSRLNQPIMTEWSLDPEVVNLIFRLWGTPLVDMFASVHNMHLPQFIYGASSTGDRFLVTGLAGEVNVHVSIVSPAQQSHSEAQNHSHGQGDTHRPLMAITTMVSTPATTEC